MSFKRSLGLLAGGVALAGLLLWGKGSKEGGEIKNSGGGVSAAKEWQFADDVKGKENLAKLSQGCRFKDCIEAIDHPKFETVTAADKWLAAEDIVFVLEYRGEHKAYPQRIMNWHEIVNDEVAGEPVAVTFCPLCGSALAFERRVGGQVVELGVSGKLYNSNLVMYDRQTESLWQQLTGEAIVGEMWGEQLKQIRLETWRWGIWRRGHPGAKVLAADTGFPRDYSQHPYGNYEVSREVYFPVTGGVDRTIDPKTVVYGIKVNGKAKAYTEAAIVRDSQKQSAFSDKLAGVRLRISSSQGEVFVENLLTKEEVMATRAFWFVWKAFNPETELYD